MTGFNPPNPAINRILDANLDRAREGLRIVEEWCRFGLERGDYAKICKDMRQKLALWHTDDLRAARNTEEDVGTELSHPQEEQRQSVGALLQANLCRIQEALRVIEEYGKLYSEEMGKECKEMRYQVYALESNLMHYRRHRQLQEAYLYLVTSPVDTLIPVVEAALQGVYP